MNSIAIISNSAFSLINFRKNLVKDLLKADCTVYLMAPDFNSKIKKEFESLGAIPVDIEMERTGLSPTSDVCCLLNLVKDLKRLNPDMTFSYGIKPVIYGLIASGFARVPKRYAMVAGLGTLYVDKDITTKKSEFLKKIADWLYKISFKFADKVFFQNPDDINYFVSGKKISEDKPILINGSGVDLERFQTEYFQTDPITFTLVSRLIKEKGIYEFVECAQKLKSKFPQEKLRFILLGDTDLNPNSIDRNMLEQWVEEDIVDWPGHVDNVECWLKETSVFVLPTYYREGTPKSILEAMAMSRPIITTDMPGCREAVTHLRNGYLVSPRNTKELVAAMEKFILKPDLIQTFGKESRKIAENRYNVKDINRIIISHMGLD